ncbi:MAG: RNA-binding protein YhbY [Tenericutes bacterium ADurb.Bin239]|jgi:RNA-binding protein|nr:MAG: RNA-binding protein YhbY [Tenericutes bacterium ADurb.Bin239]
MLSKKEMRYLRGLSNQLKAQYQLGKNEITDTFLDLLEKALVAKEILKVHVLKSVNKEVTSLALSVAASLNATVVETKGRTFTLYRQNTKEPKIKFPK